MLITPGHLTQEPHYNKGFGIPVHCGIRVVAEWCYNEDLIHRKYKYNRIRAINGHVIMGSQCILISWMFHLVLFFLIRRVIKLGQDRRNLLGQNYP